MAILAILANTVSLAGPLVVVLYIVIAAAAAITTAVTLDHKSREVRPSPPPAAPSSPRRGHA